MRAPAVVAAALLLVAPSVLAQVDDVAPTVEGSQPEPPPQKQPQPPPQRQAEPPPRRQPEARQSPPPRPPPPPANASPRQGQAQPPAAPPCPPPAPPAQGAPPPAPGAISGSTICGATIIGGTISGATILGGSISNAPISGGTISQSQISTTNTAPPPPQNQPPQSAEAATPQPPPPAANPAPQPQQAPANAAPQARVPDPPARNGSSEQGRSPRRKPGAADTAKDDDDEDEADLAARALERALVQRGALLLPVWGFEIAPAFSYGHTSQDGFATLPPATDGAPPTTVGVRRRIHQLSGALTARLGLPFDLQLEASMPAAFVVSDVTVAGAADSMTSGFGPGDPRFTLTWQAIHAGEVAPDILLAANVKPKIGSSPFESSATDIGVGSGYASVGGTVTAVKSADPLVLLANAGYTYNLPVNTAQGRRSLGPAIGLGGGAILAVSPDTSMSFLLDFRYKPDDKIGGKAIPGSDETSAVLQIGLGRVLSRRVLLNINAGIGLTADSPNLTLGVSMPIRF